MFLKEALFARTSIPLVAKSLDACTLRGRAIANNLANLTTPGYQRIEVAFEDRLKKALDEKQLAGATDQSGHMSLGRLETEQLQPVAYRSQDATLPGEINNVDVDMEAAKLAENQLMYMFGIKFIQERKADISAAIAGHA
ncbi:MAG: flagellar basal-body rod protein FlgB [Fibrobacteres bacterium]|nr:flagellar basal-body rod protein FlgB [Fibrobacterota bacterium]